MTIGGPSYQQPLQQQPPYMPELGINGREADKRKIRKLTVSTCVLAVISVILASICIGNIAYNRFTTNTDLKKTYTYCKGDSYSSMRLSNRNHILVMEGGDSDEAFQCVVWSLRMPDDLRDKIANDSTEAKSESQTAKWDKYIVIWHTEDGKDQYINIQE